MLCLVVRQPLISDVFRSRSIYLVSISAARTPLLRARCQRSLRCVFYFLFIFLVCSVMTCRLI